MSSAKALKKKIAKRAKQKKNIQVKNSIRLKQKVETAPDSAQTSDDLSLSVPATDAAAQ